jgi:hypothetical protein
MNTISKETVIRALEKGDYSLYSKSASATAVWWEFFDRIRNEEEKIVPFVRCRRCCSVLAFDSKKTGTSSLSTHAKMCRAPPPNSNHNIATMLGRSTTTSPVSADTKRLVSEALAQMCAEDIRPFEIVAGSGFEYFCQTLLDIGRKSKDYISISCLLPDPTTVSRRLQVLADGENLQYLFSVSLHEDVKILLPRKLFQYFS